MTSMIEKSLLLGLGVMTMTREKVKDVVDTLVEEGDVQREEASKTIDKLVARGEEEREAIKKMLRKEMEKYNVGVPLATREDVEQLSKKVDRLSAKLEALEAQKAEKESE